MVRMYDLRTCSSCHCDADCNRVRPTCILYMYSTYTALVCCNNATCMHMYIVHVHALTMYETIEMMYMYMYTCTCIAHVHVLTCTCIAIGLHFYRVVF